MVFFVFFLMKQVIFCFCINKVQFLFVNKCCRQLGNFVSIFYIGKQIYLLSTLHVLLFLNVRKIQTVFFCTLIELLEYLIFASIVQCNFRVEYDDKRNNKKHSFFSVKRVIIYITIKALVCSLRKHFYYSLLFRIFSFLLLLK